MLEWSFGVDREDEEWVPELANLVGEISKIIIIYKYIYLYFFC